MHHLLAHTRFSDEIYSNQLHMQRKGTGEGVRIYTHVHLKDGEEILCFMCVLFHFQWVLILSNGVINQLIFVALIQSASGT